MSNLHLERVEAWARSELDRKNAAREQALRWSRDLVRTCANSIRAVHRHEFAAALLMPHQVCMHLSAYEIATRYGVSFTVAQTRKNKIMQRLGEKSIKTRA